ncbi:MAG: GTPase [Planctomycetaceae bacterium]
MAVLRLVGDPQVLDDETPLFVAANGKRVATQSLNRLCFGHWGRTDREEVLICRVDRRITEIHCHGGSAAISRIFADLQSRGVTIGESLTLSAGQGGETPSNSHKDTLRTETLRALLTAPTRRTAAYLLTAEDRIREALQPLFAALQTERPYIPRHAVDTLTQALDWSAFGRHLVQPWRIVIAGRPNVGKSTLMNAALGYSRSIVFDQPGTTRDVVTAQSAIDGWPIEFADTAGIRDQVDSIEADGIARSWQQLSHADLRLVLIDISQPPTAVDRSLLAQFPDALCIANKADLPSQWDGALPPNAMEVSSLTGAGIDRLLQQISTALVPRLPEPSTPFPVTDSLHQTLEDLLAACQTDSPAAAFDLLSRLW